MAVKSSTTAVAAIAPNNAGSLSSLVAHSTQPDHNSPAVERHRGLAEKIHGITEKLHTFGHHNRSDTDASCKSRTGQSVTRYIDVINQHAHVIHVHSICHFMWGFLFVTFLSLSLLSLHSMFCSMPFLFIFFCFYLFSFSPSFS